MTGRSASFDIGHPAPHRGRIRLVLLALGLVGAPLAWGIQMLVIYAFASQLCLAEQPPSWLHWLLPIANVVGFAAALSATALSYTHLKATRGEREDQRGDIMDAGEGRTRFLAIWGIWLGALFSLAIAFNTISFFWEGLCGP